MIQAGSPLDSSSGDCAAAAPPPTEGIVGGIDNAINLVRRVLSDLFRLFSLEARRAGLALAWMVALGAMAAILVVTAWLGLMGALALWAVALGWTWVGAMVAIALTNFLMAAIAMLACLGISRNLLFPATRRQLDAAPARSDAA